MQTNHLFGWMPPEDKVWRAVAYCCRDGSKWLHLPNCFCSGGSWISLVLEMVSAKPKRWPPHWQHIPMDYHDRQAKGKITFAQSFLHNHWLITFACLFTNTLPLYFCRVLSQLWHKCTPRLSTNFVWGICTKISKSISKVTTSKTSCGHVLGPPVWGIGRRTCRKWRK